MNSLRMMLLVGAKCAVILHLLLALGVVMVVCRVNGGERVIGF